MNTSRFNLNERIPGIAATTGLVEVTIAGNPDILGEPRVAVFNSRQGKIPDSASPWLQNTLELTANLAGNSAALVSSAGMITWEMVTFKAAECGGAVILLLPEIEPALIPGLADNILRDFELDQDRTLMIFPDPEAELELKYKKFPKRDFWVAAIADRLYPVSIRSSGNLARLMELFSIIPGKVEDKFRIDYAKPSGSPFSLAKLMKLAGRAEEEEDDWDYLTHWTRTTINPWPGESKAEFCRSLAEASGGYSHDGYGTLCRILRDKRIFASDKFIKGGFEVVSLTELPPWELSKMIKWRSRLLRWTFEPYGIAVKRDVLEGLGARKVIYGHDYQYRFLQGEDRAYFQSAGRDGNDWREEKEWRFPEDIDLKLFSPDDVKVIVHTFDEAEELGEWSPFPVVFWEQFGAEAEEGSE